MCLDGYTGADCSSCASGFEEGTGDDADTCVLPVSGVAEVEVTLILSDTSSIGAEGSDEREQFVADFKDAVSDALGISASRLRVEEITVGSSGSRRELQESGSVVVSFVVLPPEDPAGEPSVSSVVADLREQVEDTGSDLALEVQAELGGSVDTSSVPTISFSASDPADVRIYEHSIDLTPDLTLEWGFSGVECAVEGDGCVYDLDDLSSSTLLAMRLTHTAVSSWSAIAFHDSSSMGGDAIVVEPGRDQTDRGSTTGLSASTVQALEAGIGQFDIGSGKMLGSVVFDSEQDLVEGGMVEEGGQIISTFVREVGGSGDADDRNLMTDMERNRGTVTLLHASGAGVTMGYHSARGALKVNLLNGSNKELMTVNPVAFVHGFLMTLGWGILIPLGIAAVKTRRGSTAAERLKQGGAMGSFVPSWWRWHKKLQPAGFGLALIGVIVAIVMVDKDGGAHVWSSHAHGGGGAHQHSPHGKLGLGVMVVGLVQVILAFVRPSNPSGTEKKSCVRKMWEWSHRILGYGATICAYFAIATGAVLAELGPGGAVGIVGASVAVVAAVSAWLYRTRANGGGKNTIPSIHVYDSTTAAGPRTERIMSMGMGQSVMGDAPGLGSNGNNPLRQSAGKHKHSQAVGVV